MTEESDVAVVCADLVVKPAMDDDAVLRPVFLKAVISNRRSRRQICAMHVPVFSHEMPFLARHNQKARAVATAMPDRKLAARSSSREIIFRDGCRGPFS